MRSLLAYLPTYPTPARPEFTTSIASVAHRLQARVLAMTTEPVFRDSSNWALSDLMNSVANNSLAQARQAAALLASTLEQAASAKDIEVVRETVFGDPTDFRRAVGSASRVHDLTAIELNKNDPEREVAEAVVFGSRRPLLILPKTLVGVFSPQRILIAWDGGAASARALTESLPWLSGASSIELVSVQEDDTGSAMDKCPKGATTDDAAGYLLRHGVMSPVRVLQRDDKPVDVVLFDYAEKFEADLVVMGAYGHSRAREFVLGGVTRRALCDPRLPLLMAH